MKTFRWRSGLLAVGVVFAITACREKASIPTPEPAQETRVAQAAVARAQNSLREVTDILVKQVAAANTAGKNDAAITEAIRAYEALPAAERVKFIVNDDRLRDVFSAWGDPTDQVPAPYELQQWARQTRSSFPFLKPTPSPETNFDLAERKTQMFVQQVRLTNELFRDADPSIMTAVDAWEKMTPEQKRTFTMAPEVTAYYWQYVYNIYRLQLLRYHWQYMRECYWGYKTPREMDLRASLGDRQFDLDVVKQQ